MPTQSISTPKTTFSRYLVENQQEIATKEASRATMYKVAAVIAAIAAIAISGALTAVFLGVITETALSGWATFGAIAAFIAAMATSNTLFSWAKESGNASVTYQKYADKYLEIQNWSETQFLEFFSVNDIDMSKYTSQYIELMREKEPTVPYKVLSRLISRFQVAVAQANEETETAIRQLPGMNSTGNTEPLRQMHREIFNRAMEMKAYRHLEAAFYLHCLKEPSFAVPATDSKLFEVIAKGNQLSASTTDNVFAARRYKQLQDFAMSHQPREIRPLLFT